MIYYKVVRTHDDKLVSSNWALTKKLRVEYKLDEFVFPKIGKLFVFDNLGCARAFWLGEGDELYECEVQNPTPAPSHIPTVEDAEIYWRNNQVAPGCKFKPPSSTVFCDAVKLTRRIL